MARWHGNHEYIKGPYQGGFCWKMQLGNHTECFLSSEVPKTSWNFEGKNPARG